ncbi:hypothetical protein [Rhodococcus sp. IEGM 1318]|uniref:hypothetical protein n=1 Tax=Rhodococcus sp. IEGM 1318 TaxID=3082226 RepID=UPI00295331CA|nr:hypothetical protein [Rhodococcus sp. IEGM 1318]MDV8006736.1 hypothetical protein [Rhodococcus sp. IEGM 1318]
MTNPNIDILGNLLREKLAEQPWVKRYANTVTSAVGFLVALVWLLVSVGVDLPAEVTSGVLLLVSALTMVGVKFTPNGVTEKQVDEIEAYVGRHRSDG